jgi:N-acyl-D-amino-acid deacylase
VASFVGTASVRIHVIGHAARSPNAAELETMCGLVRQAMADGAVGVSSALIYAPDCFYKTDELMALARAAAEYDGCTSRTSAARATPSWRRWTS